MDRIARILGTNTRARRTSFWRSAVAFAAGAVVTVAGIVHAAKQDERPRDDGALVMLQQLASVADTDSTELQELYDRLVFNGSKTGLRMDEHIADIEARINAAVERGDLSPTEAQEKLVSIEREMAFKADMKFLQDLFLYTPGEAYLALSQDRIEEAVRRGELTADEAAAKMAEIERGINLREEYGQAVRTKAEELKAAVNAGRITAEQGERRLKAFEQGLKVRFEFRAAERRLGRMVDAGKLTREQADERLAAMKERMGSRGERGRIDWDRLVAALEDAGIPREKLRVAAAPVEKIAEEIRTEGPHFELEPRISAWLDSKGFTDDEVAIVIGLARRIASADH